MIEKFLKEKSQFTFKLKYDYDLEHLSYYDSYHRILKCSECSGPLNQEEICHCQLPVCYNDKCTHQYECLNGHFQKEYLEYQENYGKKKETSKEKTKKDSLFPKTIHLILGELDITSDGDDDEIKSEKIELNTKIIKFVKKYGFEFELKLQTDISY